MLANKEITVESRSGAATPVALFDLSREQTGAVADGLGFYHRRRFAGAELDADSALAMYAVAAVSDQLRIDEAELEGLPTGVHRFRQMPLPDEVARLAAELIGR